MRSIADCADGLFHQWLNTDGLPFQFDALLFSASGNDFIDAALKPGDSVSHIARLRPKPQWRWSVGQIQALDRTQPILPLAPGNS